MVVPGSQLNRFERVVFTVALVLAGILVAARLGAIVVLTILRHCR